MNNALPDWVHDLPETLDTKLGIELVELTPERVVGRMPVEGNTQPVGLLHGGASAVLVETLGSLGASAHALPEGIAVGVDLNITHVRSARSGMVTGTATAVHLGSKLAAYSVEIHDEAGRLISLGRISCQLVPMPQG